jgi:hypothetical protein
VTNCSSSYSFACHIIWVTPKSFCVPAKDTVSKRFRQTVLIVALESQVPIFRMKNNIQKRWDTIGSNL